MKKRYALYQVNCEETLCQKQLLGYCSELPKEKKEFMYRDLEGRKEVLGTIAKLHTLSHNEYSVLTEKKEYRIERN